jgi:hypothetical protein
MREKSPKTRMNPQKIFLRGVCGRRGGGGLREIFTHLRELHAVMGSF